MKGVRLRTGVGAAVTIGITLVTVIFGPEEGQGCQTGFTPNSKSYAVEYNY